MKLGRYISSFADELTKIAAEPDEGYLQFLTQPGPPSPPPAQVVLQCCRCTKDYLYWRTTRTSGPYARGGF